MRQTAWLLVLMLTLAAAPGAAQRRGRAGPVTFAIFVSDTAGAPLGGVAVSVDGPVKRRVSTEAGRIALEDLPAGIYHFTFERDGYYPERKDVTGRGRAPIDVKVTMTPLPKLVPGLRPAPPRPVQSADAKGVAVDLPAFIEKNYVGRAAGKILPLACGAGGTSTLMQINEPVAEHAHADADEFVYVIAGAGSARVSGREENLRAGVFLMVPRGVAHAFTATGKSPLVLLSTRAGEGCGS